MVFMVAGYDTIKYSTGIKRNEVTQNPAVFMQEPAREASLFKEIQGHFQTGDFFLNSLEEDQ